MLEYATDLFDRASVEAMAARLVRLLEAAVAEPERAIGSLDILSPEERRTILQEWNDTARAVPSATLPELFAAQVGTTPDAIAVVFEESSLSYGELDARANQLAHHLRALGVGPEIVVGLCVERSLEMLVGLLGILKAGGAYLPLDPAYPPERLAFMLADAGAPVLVTQSALRDRLPAHGARIVRLDADWPAIAAQPASAPAAFLHPQHPAYVIYTSGSTGHPRASPSRIAASSIYHAAQMADYSDAAATIVVLCRSRRSASMLRSAEIRLPLLHGASVVVAARAVEHARSAACSATSSSGTTCTHRSIRRRRCWRDVDADPDAVRCIETHHLGGEVAVGLASVRSVTRLRQVAA